MSLTSVFLQVRLDSSRLPRKALLPLGDRLVVEHAMRSLNAVDADNRMLLTTEDSAEELSPLARKAGWELFTGPKDDVLERFILAARQSGCDRIVRATGDNPLVSARMANEALKLSSATGAAYAGFGGLPIGSGVEVIQTAALEEAWNEATDPYEREHVAPFLYRRTHRYQIEIPAAPEEYRAEGFGITLDTENDYEYLKKLFAELYTGEVLDLDTVVPWILENPRT